jgi:hypothetical protein
VHSHLGVKEDARYICWWWNVSLILELKQVWAIRLIWKRLGCESKSQKPKNDY